MIQPMLASLADAPLEDPELVYEPKYDGIRAIAEIGDPVRLWSRLGNEKTQQFPEVVAVLRQWARRLEEPLVLDGELVALDAKGNPVGFQNLQRRIHLGRGRESQGTQRNSHPLSADAHPVAFIVFDILRIGSRDLRDRPLYERRAELERVFAVKARPRSPLLRISEQVAADGRALYKRALEEGWEGLIAKHRASLYKSGKRTPDWRKLKILQEQEFVIAGWTEPRHTRGYFGALLLGVYDSGDLIYTGHTGTGFNERELARLMALMKPLETRESPFRAKPKTNEKAHWVQPTLVAQVKFTEWTADGKLRHPVYLGLRDDKKPEDVVREKVSRKASAKVRLTAFAKASAVKKPDTTQHRTGHTSHDSEALVNQLRAIEDSRRDGFVTLPDGDTLKVTNLQKVFWPKLKLTKGDLLRYYARVAPVILPAVEDRPLVMKRLPNGIGGPSFYQHNAPDEVPNGVRVETLSDHQAERGFRGPREAPPGDRGPRIDNVPSRLIGGNLKTLLYMTQLAAISQDPWFSRVQSPEDADQAAIDLDPMPGVSFARVLDVARWVRDELAAIGAMGVPKTSGVDGLHIYVPLPPKTPYEAGMLFCQIIATIVAHKHPKVATVARAVRTRGQKVYVDYLQNIPGKTLATAYSARGSEYAGVSTPLTWAEVDEGVAREDFTIETMPARLKAVGDLWKTLRTAKGVDLARAARLAGPTNT